MTQYLQLALVAISRLGGEHVVRHSRPALTSGRVSARVKCCQHGRVGVVSVCAPGLNGIQRLHGSKVRRWPAPNRIGLDARGGH